MHSVIDNGMRGGVIKALFSTKTKELLPHFLGGFRNHIITKNNIIKPTNSEPVTLAPLALAFLTTSSKTI